MYSVFLQSTTHSPRSRPATTGNTMAIRRSTKKEKKVQPTKIMTMMTMMIESVIIQGMSSPLLLSMVPRISSRVVVRWNEAAVIRATRNSWWWSSIQSNPFHTDCVTSTSQWFRTNHELTHSLNRFHPSSFTMQYTLGSSTPVHPANEIPAVRKRPTLLLKQKQHRLPIIMANLRYTHLTNLINFGKKL